MIHNCLKFTSMLLAPRGWRVRNLDWHLSQPGFDPGYGKLIYLATLISSDRTKQICLWMTIYVYWLLRENIAYIYIGSIFSFQQTLRFFFIIDSFKYDNIRYSLVPKSYGEYDIFFFYLGKCNFLFYNNIKKNLYTFKEIEKSISKVSTNWTFRLSKLYVNKLRCLSVRWPNLNHNISCQPVGVKRSQAVGWDPYSTKLLYCGLIDL